jgi:5'(3')-deoxyribonucleotidase
MKPERIVFAKAIDDKTLMVKFTNLEIRKYDISKLLDNPMFAILRNPGFFRNFKIEPNGYGLIWNDEIDLSEYELWQYGISLTDEEIERYIESIL